MSLLLFHFHLFKDALCYRLFSKEILLSVVYGYYQSIELSLKRDSAGLDSGTIIVHRELLLSTFS